MFWRGESPGTKGSTMKCHEDKETASRYLSDLLGARERAEYERHLAECPECAAEVERYRRMMDLLRNLPQIKAPASLRASVMEKISPGTSAEPQRVSILRSWRFRAVAALLVLAAGAVVMFKMLTPTQFPTSASQSPKSALNVADNLDKAKQGRDAGDYMGFGYESPNVATHMDAGSKLLFDAYVTSPMDMPGGYDVVAFTSALNRVDNALYSLNMTDLKAFAAKDQTAFVDFAATAGMPDIQKAQLKSRADNVVFMQMAQKRVVANAFERAKNMDEVTPILNCYNDVMTQQQYVAKDVLSNVTPSGRFQADSALKPDAGAAPPQAAEKPADDTEGKVQSATEAQTPQTAEAEEMAKQEAERLAEKTRDESQGLEYGTEMDREKLAGGEAAPATQNKALQQRFQRSMDGDKTEMALNFRQSIVLFGVTPDGKKRALNETEKNDIKLVFDCLPTLEDYQSAQFTPGGITVRLSESEFLRLLKYLKDMADVKAEIGPIYAELLPATSAAPVEARNEADQDPYAVDVTIVFE